MGLLAAGFLLGVAAHEYELAPYPQLRRLARGGRDLLRGSPPAGPPGRWRAAPGETGADGVSEELAALSAVGYLAATRPAEGPSGVRLHQPDRVFAGLNLYCSGHGPEAILVDMAGRPVHRWRLPFAEAFPGDETAGDDFRAEYWRKVHLLPDGSLLAIFDGLGVVKVDRRSRLVWARRNGAHHDLWVDRSSGEIYVLTRRPRMMPEVHPRRPVLEDAITVLSADGSELRSQSVVRAILDSRFSALLDFSDGHGDLLHTNSLVVADAALAPRLSFFRPGRALLSMPEINTVAVVDLGANRVVWALSALFEFQHDPAFLPSGRLLVFDNRPGSERSRVLELDPATQEVLWSYGEEPGEEFYSECCGTSQRLPNGNTLITVSEAGRAIEVAADGALVWEYRSPHRGGAAGELVATLFEMTRLAAEPIAAWLDQASPPGAGGGSPSPADAGSARPDGAERRTRASAQPTAAPATR